MKNILLSTLFVGTTLLGIAQKKQVAPTNIAFKIDDSIRQVQIEKINTLKQNRDNTKVAACLDAITTAAKGTDNIMPLVVEAVENKATLGEISNALRLVFGEF